MELPDEDPGGFELFVHWLYEGSIPTTIENRSSAEKQVSKLIELHIFALKIGHTILMNLSMNSIQDVLNKHDLTLTAEQIDGIYSKTEASSLLRQFCAATILHKTTSYDGFEEEGNEEIESWEEGMAMSCKKWLTIMEDILEMMRKRRSEYLPLNSDCRIRQSIGYDACFFH
jgi:hypothetical protein